MPLNESRVQEGWVVFEHCSLFLLFQVSESARCSGFWVPLCLSCLSSMSEHGCTLPLQSAPVSVWGSLFPPHAMHRNPLFSPWGCSSSLLSDSSCKHTSVSSKWEHMGGSAYLFSVAGEAAQCLEVGEHTEAPPCVPHLVHIYSSLLLSYQRVGHCSDLDVWVDGGLQPCPFHWCVVMFFNGDFSLHLLMCLCISAAAAYTCPKESIIGRGTLAGTLMCE